MADKKVSFEEAANTSQALFSKTLRESGPTAAIAAMKSYLDDIGWTNAELCEESRRRVLVRIAELKAQQHKEKS